MAWRVGPAGSHLLQLPEGAYEARAEAEDDEQQQKGLVGGRDVYHVVESSNAHAMRSRMVFEYHSLTNANVA